MFGLGLGFGFAAGARAFAHRREIGGAHIRSAATIPHVVIPDGVREVRSGAFLRARGLAWASLPMDCRLGPCAFPSRTTLIRRLPLRMRGVLTATSLKI